MLQVVVLQKTVGLHVCVFVFSKPRWESLTFQEFTKPIPVCQKWPQVGLIHDVVVEVVVNYTDLCRSSTRFMCVQVSLEMMSQRMGLVKTDCSDHCRSFLRRNQIASQTTAGPLFLSH